MVLAGLWFGQQHPVFNTFMKPIREVLLKLERDGKYKIYEQRTCGYLLRHNNIGLTLTLPNGSTILTKAFMLFGVYDIPAKSDVVGTVNHRSQYACTRCLHPGKVIKTVKGI